MKIPKALAKLEPCGKATTWIKDQPSRLAAWNNCQRGDWMLWLAGKLSGLPEGNGRKKLVLCACECARLALPHTKNPDVLTCIETTERWAIGKATIEELRKSRSATDATAYAATAAYAAATAADAADAAYAADAATAYAAAAAYAAATAADVTARQKTLTKCADIVRKHYPKIPRAR